MKSTQSAPRRRYRWMVLPGLAAAIVAGTVGGAMAAQAAGLHAAHNPSGVATQPGGVTGRPSDPGYQRNAHGLTFGSELDAPSPDQAPDLILVEATNGKDGYVYRSALDAATGGDVKTPQEAASWQAQANANAAAHKVIEVPVYQSDGTTRIGTFVVHPSTMQSPTTEVP